MYVTEPWLAIATRHQDARAWPATVFHFPQLGGTHPCLAIKKGNFHPFQKLFRVSVFVVGFVVVLGFCCFVCVVLVILVMWGFVCVCWGGGGILFGFIWKHFVCQGSHFVWNDSIKSRIRETVYR